MSDLQVLRTTEPPGIDANPQGEVSIDTRSLQYVAKYDHLTCPICQQPFINPYTTICGHTFCHGCIMECMNSAMSNKCPLDRTELHYDEGSEDADIFPAPIIISNLTDDLEVKCCNSKRGCPWTGPRWQIKSHVSKTCEYTRYVCDREGIDGTNCELLAEKRYLDQSTKCPHIEFPCAKCNEMVCQVDEQSHLDNKCEKNLVGCHGCGLQFPKKDLKDHESYCEKVHLKCPGAKFGCDWRGNRDVLETVHEPECIFVKMSGYLEKQEQRIAEVTSENDLLKREMSTLLDSVMQGRLTNLGFNLEEVTGSNEYKRLMREFEQLQIGAQRARRALSDLEVSKHAFSDLSTDTMMIKEDVTSQRLVLTALRQQVQYLMNMRRRSTASEDLPKL